MPEPAVPQSESDWDDIERRFELAAEHRILLQVAREAWRRYVEIRDRLDEEGLITEGRFVPRANPLISLEVTTRAAMIRALKALNLPEES